MTKTIEKDPFKATWNYQEAPESTDHIHIKKQYDLYIDGKFTKPINGKYFDTINPATNTYLELQDSFKNAPGNLQLLKV